MQLHLSADMALERAQEESAPLARIRADIEDDERICSGHAAEDCVLKQDLAILHGVIWDV
jgi:hypothetical protein